jgi:hypothetical protein
VWALIVLGIVTQAAGCSGGVLPVGVEGLDGEDAGPRADSSREGDSSHVRDATGPDTTVLQDASPDARRDAAPDRTVEDSSSQDATIDAREELHAEDSASFDVGTDVREDDAGDSSLLGSPDAPADTGGQEADSSIPETSVGDSSSGDSSQPEASTDSGIADTAFTDTIGPDGQDTGSVDSTLSGDTSAADSTTAADADSGLILCPNNTPPSGSCAGSGECTYLGTTESGTCWCSFGSPPTSKLAWRCTSLAAGCPDTQPDPGTPCVVDPTVTCDYGACVGGGEFSCANGSWTQLVASCPQ